MPRIRVIEWSERQREKRVGIDRYKWDKEKRKREKKVGIERYKWDKEKRKKHTEKENIQVTH
jgi:hypothetical protein